MKKQAMSVCKAMTTAVLGIVFSAGTASAAVAVGGDQSEIYADGVCWRIHIFTNSGTLNVTAGGEFEYLIVAGGGGGGNGLGGTGTSGGAGGGAGGLLTNVGGTFLQVGDGSYTVTVGSGGAAGASGSAGSNGGDSSFAGVTATGGGGGGGNSTSGGSTRDGRGGGSGGGAYMTYAAGLGTFGQGCNGGLGQSTGSGSGGGGGGAGEVGQNAPSNSLGGPGGMAFKVPLRAPTCGMRAAAAENVQTVLTFLPVVVVLVAAVMPVSRARMASAVVEVAQLVLPVLERADQGS
jgi:hypothetical protein